MRSGAVPVYDPYVARNPPTSMRFSADEIELLDAWRHHLDERNHTKRTSRTDVVRFLLWKMIPPEGLGTPAVVRRAHATLFGKTEETT